MPILRNYNVGAVIYMEGEKSEYIYVLKSGKVSLTYQDFDTLAEIVDHIKEGEFFGVQAVLGNYKREEICKAQSNTELLLLTKKEFANLVTKNYKLVLDMLKVLSTQLRKIGKKASELVSANANSDDSEELSMEEKLYNLGDYYLTNKNYSYALYIFSRQIKLYQKGQLSAEAQKHVEYIKSKDK